jgi:signal transduction histidine kinase
MPNYKPFNTMRSLTFRLETRAPQSWTTVQTWIRWAGISAVYFLFARFSLLLSYLEGNVSPIWLPSGISLACVLIIGPQALPAIFLGELLVTLSLHDPWYLTFGASCGAVVEAYLGYTLLKRFDFNRSFSRLQDVITLVFQAAGLSTFVAAFCGVGPLIIDRMPLEKLENSFFLWWVGDALGIILMTPFLLSLSNSSPWEILKITTRKAECFFLLVLTVLVSYSVFSNPAPIVYVLFPLVIWACLRFSKLISSLQIILISVIAMWFGGKGMGPFVSAESSLQSLVWLQLFVGSIAVTALLISVAVMAEKASEEKSRFVANINHEIRTPLGAIVGFTDLAEDSLNSPEDLREYLHYVKRNARHLQDLINEVLDLSKIESGSLIIEMQPNLLESLLTDIAATLKMRADEKKIDFSIVQKTELPIQITTDSMRLKQILLNVAGNAIKFTETGSVRIEISAVPSHGSPVQLTFRVVDTGIGILPQDTSKLFSPFVQAEASTTRRYGGTGLGLVISKRLAEALGGQLVLEETHLKRGSTFTLIIPAEAVW